MPFDRFVFLMAILATTLSYLFPSTAFASYRVYQLRVTHWDVKGNPKNKEVVMSTLDHLQYEHYHGSFGRAQVEYLDSWYCPGDTSRRSFCQKPKSPERTITSEREKRRPIP